MGSLDSGPTHREYLLGALERDDLNWELKSSIRALLGYADARNKPAPYRELEAELKLLKKWAAEAEAALARIRQRHRKLTHTRGDGSKYGFCAECLDYPTYPCHTIKDLAPRETIPPEKETQ